jgi:hypothetical protein
MEGVYPDQIEFELARGHLESAEADVLLVGHTHLAFALEVAEVGTIANPAALLRSPADGADGLPATGTFGVLELPSRRFRVFRADDGSEIGILRRRIDPRA